MAEARRLASNMARSFSAGVRVLNRTFFSFMTFAPGLFRAKIGSLFSISKDLQHLFPFLGRDELAIRPPRRRNVGAATALLDVKLRGILPDRVAEFAELLHESAEVGDRVVDVCGKPGTVIPPAEQFIGGDGLTLEVLEGDFSILGHPDHCPGRLPFLGADGVHVASLLDQFPTTGEERGDGLRVGTLQGILIVLEVMVGASCFHKFILNCHRSTNRSGRGVRENLGRVFERRKIVVLARSLNGIDDDLPTEAGRSNRGGGDGGRIGVAVTFGAQFARGVVGGHATELSG